MLRSRQRTLWLVCIAALWIVGVYVVYQKVTSNNLLNTWPAAGAKKSHVRGEAERAVEKLLTNLDQLEAVEGENRDTYQELNKKFIYFIDKKYKSKPKAVVKTEEEGEKKDDKLSVGVIQPLEDQKQHQVVAAEEPEELNSDHEEEVKKQIAIPGPNDGPPGSGIRIPVVVFACNRRSVSVCLDNLLKYRPSAHQFPIIVSQVREKESKLQGCRAF